MPPSYPPGIRYTVASLKDHLGIEGTDLSVYWALINFPALETINGPTNKYEVKITLDSTDPKMLVYVYAKSEISATEYDMKAPPDKPRIHGSRASHHRSARAKIRPSSQHTP